MAMVFPFPNVYWKNSMHHRLDMAFVAPVYLEGLQSHNISSPVALAVTNRHFYM
jgi:hypothetical protein